MIPYEKQNTYSTDDFSDTYGILLKAVCCTNLDQNCGIDYRCMQQQQARMSTDILSYLKIVINESNRINKEKLNVQKS